MHIVLIGNTGSGKTTLAKGLAERLGLPIVSSGDVARALAETDASTRLALEQGAMAPEQAMRAEVRSRLEEAEATRGGWVLDGFPRTLEQLVCLSQWTAAMPSYLMLELGVLACVERLTQRGREHDNPDAVARRLEFFRTQTGYMVAALDGGQALTVIDGRQSEELVLVQALETVR